MDYKRIYNKIVANRQANPLSLEEYGEVHHIVPRSLGGDDSPSNLVRLTAREHFICHALLADSYEYGTFEWYKMNHAFLMMKSSNTGQERYFNSRLYEAKRKDFSRVMSKSQSKEKNSQFGKIWIYNIPQEMSKKIFLSELEMYEEQGWMQGRVLDFNKWKERHKPKTKHYLPNGSRINKSRRDFCLKWFGADLYTSQGRKDLYELLYREYVEEDRSTTYLAKKYGITDPTIRKLLIDFDIGTKDRGGKW
jgi:hypothetical protein